MLGLRKRQDKVGALPELVLRFFHLPGPPLPLLRPCVPPRGELDRLFGRRPVLPEVLDVIRVILLNRDPPLLWGGGQDEGL